MALFACDRCNRHVRGHEPRCPFCGVVRASIVVAAAALAVGCQAATSPMALYGGPPVDPDVRLDAGAPADSTPPAPTTPPTTAPTTAPTASQPPSPTATPAYGAPPPNVMAPMYGGPPDRTRSSPRN